MAAQTARACSFLDRQWTIEDVIIIPSDSDSDCGTDSGDEAIDSVLHMNLLHDQYPDNDSLPSISAIVASMVNVRRDPMEGIESSTQKLYVAADGECYDSSSPSSPAGMSYTSTVLESPGVGTYPDLMVSPAIQQHDDTVAPELSTPIRGPCVVSAASQCISAQLTPILSLSDNLQHQNYAESSDQPRLSSTTDLSQPSQPQNHSNMPSDRCSGICNTNDDYGHIDGIVAQSDGPEGVAQQPLTKTLLLGCRPASPQGSFMDADQQHHASDDILPLVSCISPLPNNSRRNKEGQKSTNAHHDVSQLGEPCEEIAKRPSHRRCHKKRYNLRPLPIKRQLIGEENCGSGVEAVVAQQKRRKVMFPQPEEHGSQQCESELSPSRKPRILRKNMTKDSRNGSVANAKRPTHFGAASYREWSLAHTVLKCTRENGTSTFQLQFTSDTLWQALIAQNGPAPKDHQPPNKVKSRGPRSRKGQLNQRTENLAQQSIQGAYPSVCPDIYRMDCLLARWRQHNFLVKWSDATTTWEPRKHIIDKQELSRFEASWQGFDAGVDVLGVRLRAGKHQHLLHWHGRPSKEDTWVEDKLLSSNLLGRIKQMK